MGISIVEYFLKLGGSLPKDAKDAAKAIKETEQAADKAKNAVEKLGRMAGGPLGQLTDAAADAGDIMDGLGAAAGSAGLLVGAAAVGFTAAALGSKLLADAAVNASNRLIDQGLSAAIPQESIASLAEYTEAGKNLQTQLDLLVVSLGTDVAGAMTTVVDAGSGLLALFRDMKTGIEEASGPLGTFLHGLDILSQLSGLRAAAELAGVAFGFLAEKGREANAEIKTFAWQGPALPDGMGPMGAPSGPAKPKAAAPKLEDDPFLYLLNRSLDQNVAAVDRLTGSFEGGWGDFNDGTMDLIDELRAVAASAEELSTTMRAGGGQRGAEGLASIAGGLGGGLSSILGSAAGGPVGFAMGIAADMGDSLDNAAVNLAAQTSKFVESLPDQIGSLLEAAPGIIANVLPEILTAIATAGPQVAIELVKAAPEIAIALVEAVPAMANAFIEEISEFFTEDFWRGIWDGFSAAMERLLESLNIFNKNGALGTDLKAAKGEKRLLGVKLPSFDVAMNSPRVITETGLAVVHRREIIGGPEAFGRGGGSRVTVVVQAGNVVGQSAGEELARIIRRELGNYGLGASLAARP